MSSGHYRGEPRRLPDLFLLPPTQRILKRESVPGNSLHGGLGRAGKQGKGREAECDLRPMQVNPRLDNSVFWLLALPLSPLRTLDMPHWGGPVILFVHHSAFDRST